MTRLFGDAAHSVEDEDRELGARLIAIQIGVFDGPAKTRRRVARASLIHHHRRNVIGALRTGAKLRMRLGEGRMDLADDTLERASHTANGSGCRVWTMEPVKVEPVVPVSSTV